MDGQKTILIVDDEAEFREIFSSELSEAGFAVDTASSGEEALTKMRAQKPDLVLLDMRMPDLDGAETLIKMKADPVIADVKVMFLTSLGDPMPQGHKVNEKAAGELGAAGYMMKSEDLGKLIEKVRELVG